MKLSFSKRVTGSCGVWGITLLVSALVGCVADAGDLDAAGDDEVAVEASAQALSIAPDQRILHPIGQQESWLAQDGTSGNPGTLSGCHADYAHCKACGGLYVERECAEYSFLQGCVRYAEAFCNYNPATGVQ